MSTSAEIKIDQTPRFWQVMMLFMLLLAITGTTEAAKVRILFDAWDGPPLRVYIARPSGLKPDRPVVFVMHGDQRSAEEYRDQWHELALEYDFLLVVPEFNRADFAGSGDYYFGKMFDQSANSLPPALWSFTAIEGIFDDLRQRYAMTTDTYSLYGQSEAAQFVHRFVFHVPKARLAQAVVANSEWYAMPNFEIEYPYGLKDSLVSHQQLADALQAPVTILLGDQVTDPERPGLLLTPEAMAQGDNRKLRGIAFFNAAQSAAQELDVPCAWQLSMVEGVDHDNRLMAPAAVKILLNQSRPPDPQCHQKLATNGDSGIAT